MPSRSPTVIEQSTSLPDQNFFRNQCKKSENKDNTRTEYFQAYTLFNKQNSFNSSKKSSSTSALQRQHHQSPITDERIHFILLRQREPLAYRQPSPAASLITNRNCDFCTSRRDALQKMRLPDVYRKKHGVHFNVHLTACCEELSVKSCCRWLQITAALRPCLNDRLCAPITAEHNK